MKVYYDFQLVLVYLNGGISKYLLELTKILKNNKNITVFALFSHNLFKHLRVVPGKNKLLFLFDKKYRLNKLLILIINRIYTFFYIKINNPEIIHPSYYEPYILKYKKNRKLVITVYDMIHELYFGEFSNLNNKTINDKKKVILNADLIISISESTKKDLIKLYNIPQEKIKVIYLGGPEIIKFKKLDLPLKYILFVGNRNGYKNFIPFINSIASLLIENIDLTLVCIGGGGFTNEEKEIINNLKLKNKILQLIANDNELYYAFKNAEMFVFPSKYEGFGLPVLEAFANECPVLLSNTSSLPEVGGEAVEYFDPNDNNSILKAVNKILNNDLLKNEMRKKGLNQLSKFSWDKCANETQEAYKKLLNN